MHDPIANILLALTIIVGVGVLTLIGVLLAVAVAALKTRKRVMALLDRVESSVVPHLGPVASQLHSMVDDLSPKVKQIGTNLTAITETLRTEAQHISVSVNDMVERTHQQAARVDGMVASTLTGIGHATHAVQEGIAIPMRHLSGVLEGVRTGLNALLGRERHSDRHTEQHNGRYGATYPPPPTAHVRKIDPDQI